MSRRAPPREYFEEDDFYYEGNRDRYIRPRRREREFDDDVEYHSRRSLPPTEDLERLRIREEGPPRRYMRESFMPSKERRPLATRRSREEVDDILAGSELEDVRMRSRPRRRSYHPREIDEEEFIVDERDVHGGRRHRPPEDNELVRDKRETRGGRRHRPREFNEEDLIVDDWEARGGRRHRPREVEEDELVIDEKDARGKRRHRPYREVDEGDLVLDDSGKRRSRIHHPREVDEEDLIIDEREQERYGGWRPRPERDLEEDDIIRRKESIPRRPYDSEGDLRLRERRFEDDRGGLYRRSSGSRRRPRRREGELEEVIIDDREDRQRHGRRRGHMRPEKEELIMQWKDRPLPGEVEEEEDELRVRDIARHGQRSPPKPRFVPEQPGGFSSEQEDEETEGTDDEIRTRPRGHMKPRRQEAEEEEEEIIIRKKGRERDRRRGSTDSEQVIMRESKRQSLSPEPIRAPPIHQDIITHHRHVDHG